jgi:hypothetical protein
LTKCACVKDVRHTGNEEQAKLVAKTHIRRSEEFPRQPARLRAAVRASPRVRLACLRLAARVRCVLACSSAACLHAAHRVLAALLARGLTLAFALSTLLSLHAIILCTLADALALAFALALACSHAPPPSPSSSHAPSPSPSPSPSAQHAAHRVLAALLAPVH